MCPPNIAGEVVKIYGGGTDGKDLFHIDEPVMEVGKCQYKRGICVLVMCWRGFIYSIHGFTRLPRNLYFCIARCPRR
jgi:hypothetical protein